MDNAHNEELHSLYRSSNIFRVIKSRRWAVHVNITIRRAGHVARMVKILTGFKFTGK